MSSIREIVEIKKIDNTTLAHGFALGAINIRGATVPVIDFRVFLGKKEAVSALEITDKGFKVIVMRVGEDLVSLLVDSINNIVSYFDDELIPFPDIQSNENRLFRGCLAREGSNMVMLLDHEAILTLEEIQIVTRGHSQLFKAEDKVDDAAGSKSTVRKTLLTFSIGGDYALELQKVQEIIAYPDDIFIRRIFPPSSTVSSIFEAT